jgi:hypothetical protein
VSLYSSRSVARKKWSPELKTVGYLSLPRQPWRMVVTSAGLAAVSDETVTLIDPESMTLRGHWLLPREGGLPQGSPESPLLFLVRLDDLYVLDLHAGACVYEVKDDDHFYFTRDPSDSLISFLYLCVAPNGKFFVCGKHELHRVEIGRDALTITHCVRRDSSDYFAYEAGRYVIAPDSREVLLDGYREVDGQPRQVVARLAADTLTPAGPALPLDADLPLGWSLVWPTSVSRPWVHQEHQLFRFDARGRLLATYEWQYPEAGYTWPSLSPDGRCALIAMRKELLLYAWASPDSATPPRASEADELDDFPPKPVRGA